MQKHIRLPSEKCSERECEITLVKTSQVNYLDRKLTAPSISSLPLGGMMISPCRTGRRLSATTAVPSTSLSGCAAPGCCGTRYDSGRSPARRYSTTVVRRIQLNNSRSRQIRLSDSKATPELGAAVCVDGRWRVVVWGGVGAIRSCGGGNHVWRPNEGYGPMGHLDNHSGPELIPQRGKVIHVK